MSWTPYPEIEGCGLVDLGPHFDERGFFMELWNRERYVREGIPLPFNWAQENTSYTHEGILRGFHIQKNNPQGKLVTCLLGRVMDVCLDLRPSSKTFMNMTRVILDCGKPQSFWLPPGTAHAFIALEDSMLHYKCTTPYDSESDGGVNASSPELAMVWPPGEFYRSEKDRSLPMLMDYVKKLP